MPPAGAPAPAPRAGGVILPIRRLVELPAGKPLGAMPRAGILVPPNPDLGSEPRPDGADLNPWLGPPNCKPPDGRLEGAPPMAPPPPPPEPPPAPVGAGGSSIVPASEGASRKSRIIGRS